MRRLSTWLVLSTVSLAGIANVAHWTGRYRSATAVGAPAHMEAGRSPATWQPTSANFWAPAGMSDTTWNDGRDPVAPTTATATIANSTVEELDFNATSYLVGGSALMRSPSVAAPAGQRILALTERFDERVISADILKLATSPDPGGLLTESDADSGIGKAAEPVTATEHDVAALRLFLENDEDASTTLNLSPTGPGLRMNAITLSGTLVPISTVDGIPPAPSVADTETETIVPFTLFAENPTGLKNAVVTSAPLANPGAPVPFGAGNSLPPILPAAVASGAGSSPKFRTSKVRPSEPTLVDSGNTTPAVIVGVSTASPTVGRTLNSTTGNSAATVAPFAGSRLESAIGGLMVGETGATLSVVDTTTTTNSSPVVSFRNASVRMSDSLPASNGSSGSTIASPALINSTGGSSSGGTLTPQGSGTTQVLLVAEGTPNTIYSYPSANSQNTFSTSSSLNNPNGLAFSLSGQLYAANFGNNTVVKFTLAPGGLTGSPAGTFISSGLSGPTGLVFDTSNNLYVSNQTGSTSGNVQGYNSSGGLLWTATSSMSAPVGLAISSGTLYAANSGSNTIVKINTTTGAVSSFITAGSGLSSPTGLAFDSSGNLYVSYAGSGIVEKYSSSGADDGAFATLSGDLISSIAFNSAGDLFVAAEVLFPTTSFEVAEFGPTGSSLGNYATGLNDLSGLAFATVPEPDSFLLLLSGVIGTAAAWRQRRSPGRV